MKRNCCFAFSHERHNPFLGIFIFIMGVPQSDLAVVRFLLMSLWQDYFLRQRFQCYWLFLIFGYQLLAEFQCGIDLDRVKRIWYLSPMRAAKVQASLRIRAVSPEPSLLAQTSSESRGTFRKKARSLAPLNGWACAVKVCHDGMLEDTNSLDGAHLYMMDG